MSKTLKEFSELDGWAESLVRFAQEASQIQDHPGLRDAARRFLLAESEFAQLMLIYAGVERG